LNYQESHEQRELLRRILAVLEQIRDGQPLQRKPPQRLLARQEAAEYLHCSEGTIDNLVTQGKLHPTRFTRFPLFDIQELDRLIEESKLAS
jgi:excisionase family DNA binding protein